MIRFCRNIVASLGAGLLFASAAHADLARTYPEKPIKIVVPYAPGGFNDTIARVVGKKLQDAFGQPVIVDNRPGAGTIIGTAFAAKSPPDGYTLVVVGFPQVANQFLQKKLPYDMEKDLTPVILGAQSPNLLVVNSSSPIRSIQDLIATAKAKGGKMNYATAGNGTSPHLATEYFKTVAGIDMTQVPYKGSAQMVADLLGGQVDVMFDNAPHVSAHVKAGKMRALAITSPKRSPLLPDVATMAELGFPGFEVAVWYGFAAPAHTPPEIITKLNKEMNKILAMDDVKKTFTDSGVEAIGGSVQDFEAFFKVQSARWGKVIKDAHVAAD
jgi:tripartite-type tricarboxylate transporter receptor subunit TctC